MFSPDLRPIVDKYDLDPVNALRSQLVEPPGRCSVANSKGFLITKKLVVFLEAVQVPSQMVWLPRPVRPKKNRTNRSGRLSQLLEQAETIIFWGRNLSQWTTFVHFAFGNVTRDYRTVPATVDVVNVKKYDLIQLILLLMFFALGMTYIFLR